MPDSDLIREIAKNIEDLTNRSNNMESLADRIDARFNDLEIRLSMDTNNAKNSMDKHFETIYSKLSMLNEKVNKHENYFSALVLICTGGLASLTGSLSWIYSLFHK